MARQAVYIASGRGHKLECDMQPIRRNTIALAALLRQTAVDFLNSGLSDSYFIDVIIRENAQNVTVSGDEELLKRAVSNLITNSTRHNTSGCAITVTLDQSTGNCSISLSDSGVGFTQELLDSLNHPKSSFHLENHGLGLTIVRQIIRAHGGHLFCFSGSVCRIDFIRNSILGISTPKHTSCRDMI